MIPLVALLSAAVGAVLVWLWRHAREASLAERCRSAGEQLAKAEAELVSLRAAHGELATANTQLSTKLEAERQAHDRLVNEFKALSAEALRVNRTDFLEQAALAFGNLQKQSEGELDKRKQAVEAIVKPLRDSLEKVGEKIADVEKDRAKAYGSLEQKLEALNTAQVRLQAEAAKLSTALRSTSYAGSWGELQLRRVVEMANMLPYCDFSEQETSGSLRADMVIRLPGGKRIVVDAKAPIESYRAMLEATDEATRAARLAEHADKVRTHVDALGSKAYYAQFQPAPAFVVLFLPGDHFLTGALQADPSLMDRALAKKVLLATPTTLIALLTAAAYGWNQEKASESAEKIGELGKELYDRLTTFADHLDRVGRGLDTAVKGYNSAVGSLEGTVLPGARRFVELGAKGNKELKSPDPVDSVAREVVKRA